MAIISFVTFPKKRRYFIVEQPSFVMKKNTSGKNVRKRSTKYVPTLDTIFVDEQLKIDPNAVEEAIAISNGRLTVDDEAFPHKVDFLKTHHDFGKKFKILNIEEDEELELMAFEASDKAKKNITTAKDSVIRAMAIEFISPSAGQNKSVKSLRISLRKFTENNPDFVNRINDFANDSFNNEKLMVSTLLSKKVIKLVGKSFSWADSDESIYTASQAQDAPKSLAIWLKNDKAGRQAMSSFVEKLEKLKD